MAALSEATDMKKAVRNRILQLFSEASGSSESWLVAVLDARATRVVSSFVTMFDIMDQRITLVEALEKKRQPFPEMEVIYLVSPTKEAMQAISNDFKSKAPYGDVHIFCLSQLPSDAFDIIKANSKLVQRIKTLKEINIDFLASDPSVFHLDEKNCLPQLYGQGPAQSITPFGEKMANQLFTVCATMNEFPIVRFRSNSHLGNVALQLVSMLDGLKGSNSGWWHYGSSGHTERPQSTLLLLDRADDVLSPLLHVCSYQGLVYDLLPVEGKLIRYRLNNKDKEALLNEKDDLWMQFRHRHIADVLTGLKDYVDDIKKHNPTVVKLSGGQPGGEGGPSLAELGAMVKAMPEYQAQLERYSEHHQIASTCMGHITKSNNALLNVITDVEQTLATGSNQLGQTVRPESLMDNIIDSMMMGDAEFKLRLLLIYACQTDANEADIDRLCRAGDINASDRGLVSAIRRLANSAEKDAPSVASSGEKKKTGIFSRMLGASSSATPTQSYEYPSSRYNCPLKAIADMLAQDKLPADTFPLCPGQTPVRAVAQSVRKKNNEASRKSGSRNIIFMAGGICHGELQALQEISNAHHKEIVAGGSTVLNPSDYLNELRALA